MTVDIIDKLKCKWHSYRIAVVQNILWKQHYSFYNEGVPSYDSIIEEVVNGIYFLKIIVYSLLAYLCCT